MEIRTVERAVYFTEGCDHYKVASWRMVPLFDAEGNITEEVPKVDIEERFEESLTPDRVNHLINALHDILSDIEMHQEEVTEPDQPISTDP
jgi:hypothetical protein